VNHFLGVKLGKLPIGWTFAIGLACPSLGLDVFNAGLSTNTKERQVMRKQLITIMAFCTACMVIAAQAQSSSSSSGGSSTYPGSSSSSARDKQGSSSATSGDVSGSTSSQYQHSRTGKMGSQGEIRASQLNGAQITGSAGDSIGTVSDVLINPTSGRVDFAVISLSGGSAAVVFSVATEVGASASGPRRRWTVRSQAATESR